VTVEVEFLGSQCQSYSGPEVPFWEIAQAKCSGIYSGAEKAAAACRIGEE